MERKKEPDQEKTLKKLKSGRKPVIERAAINRLLKDGRTASQTAVELGICEQSVYRLGDTRFFRKKNRIDSDRVYEFFRQGWTPGKISSEMKISYSHACYLKRKFLKNSECMAT
jgi:hypothetical protein